MTNLLYGLHLHDMETCYKVMTTDIARSLNIECNRFDLEPEITAKIARLGHAIWEVPISYTPREEKSCLPGRTACRRCGRCSATACGSHRLPPGEEGLG